MIIDFHTHVFPEKIAESTIDKLRNASHTINFTNGTEEGLQHSMQAAGVDLSLVLPVATKVTQVPGMITTAIEKNRKVSETGLCYFAGMHPDCENYEELLEQVVEANIPGIKLHPPYQMVDFDAKSYVRILRKAEELELITVTHAGLDIGLPKSRNSTPDKIRRVIDSVQPKRLVLAHGGGFRNWKQVEELLTGQGVYFDLAFCLGEVTPYPADYEKGDSTLMSREQFLRLVEKNGADHILFATDSPWMDPQEGLKWLDASGLDQASLKFIKGENALKLLNTKFTQFLH